MKESLERIRRSVLAEAEAEASRIKNEAREQLNRLIETARREEEASAELRLARENERVEQEALMEIARAQRTARLEHLAARNRVIDGIFSIVRNALVDLPPEKYRDLLMRWLEEMDSPEGGEVLAGSRDAAHLSGIVEKINAGREKGEGFVVGGGIAPFEHGFIVRTERFEIQRSLDGWLAEKKREMMPELEKRLFGGGRDASAG